MNLDIVSYPRVYVPGRYNSAFFFKHELLKDFKYYWRMEYVSDASGFSLRSDGPLTVVRLPLRPDVRFFCDLNFDPFLLMQDQNKVYGTCDTPIRCIGEGR